jgi:uncharacterized protein YecE (DUF72 family)
MALLRIGTSGWTYGHWRGVFYPKGLKQADWLAFYAESFDSVEINATFYRLPRPEYVTRWSEAVPDDFLFAIKGSRYLTHIKRLGDTGESLDRFLDMVALFGDKEGPVLWQLPRTLERDDDLLAAFTSALFGGRRHVFEFRHESWYCREVFDILERAGAALCIPDRPETPGVFEITADWTYFRFHAGSMDGLYSPQELKNWMARISALLADDIDVYAYFNNDRHGYAIKNARELREMLVSA